MKYAGQFADKMHSDFFMKQHQPPSIEKIAAKSVSANILSSILSQNNNLSLNLVCVINEFGIIAITFSQLFKTLSIA